MNQYQDIADTDEKTLGEYVSIFRRRKLYFIVPAATVFILTALFAWFWPPTYRSTATILIEEQEIPRDLVRSTITSYANQQIQVISQRIMTQRNINEIVERHNLYTPEELRRIPRSEIARDFQSRMRIDLISADVIDPRSGRPTQATIAFNLSFDDRSPNIAQRVANELVTLYLNENLRARTQHAASTFEFLRAEGRALRQRMAELEGQLARFKEENQGALPELYQYNLQVVDRTEREIAEITLRLRELEKTQLDYDARLAQLSRYAPTILPTGEAVLGDYDRLRALRSEYSRATASYSADHPDVRRLGSQIRALEANLGIDGGGDEDAARELADARDRLAGLQERYSHDHPEVLRQQQLLTSLERRALGANGAVQSPQPDNPAWVLLNTQLQITRSETRALAAKQAELRERLTRHEGFLQRTPEVERSYNNIVLDLDNARAKYRELSAKQMEAELAQSLEQDRRGERFTLIDPPVLPQEPVSPNRVAILLIGLILGGITGVGVVALLEALDCSIRGERQLYALTGVNALAVVPYITAADEVVRGSQRRYWIAGAAVVALLVVLLVFHAVVRPLDVVFFILLNRLGLN